MFSEFKEFKREGDKILVKRKGSRSSFNNSIKKTNILYKGLYFSMVRSNNIFVNKCRQSVFL